MYTNILGDVFLCILTSPTPHTSNNDHHYNSYHHYPPYITANTTVTTKTVLWGSFASSVASTSVVSINSSGAVYGPKPALVLARTYKWRQVTYGTLAECHVLCSHAPTLNWYIRLVLRPDKLSEKCFCLWEVTVLQISSDSDAYNGYTNLLLSDSLVCML